MSPRFVASAGASLSALKIGSNIGATTILGSITLGRIAWSILPRGGQGFELFAYRLLPIRYSKEGEVAFEIAAPNVEPLPPGFVTLGFDVANKPFSPFFECSPLSCNRMADEVLVNQFCLLPALNDAIAFARRCAMEEPEPGPFYVSEILRER